MNGAGTAGWVPGVWVAAAEEGGGGALDGAVEDGEAAGTTGWIGVAVKDFGVKLLLGLVDGDTAFEFGLDFSAEVVVFGLPLLERGGDADAACEGVDDEVAVAEDVFVPDVTVVEEEEDEDVVAAAATRPLFGDGWVLPVTGVV